MLVTNLYRLPPYTVSPSLWSCFIVLLEERKNRRLLLLSWGIPLGCVLLFEECLFCNLHVLMAVPLTYSVHVWAYYGLSLILLGIFYLSHCQFSDTVLSNMYFLFVQREIECNTNPQGHGPYSGHNNPTCKNRQWEDIYIYTLFNHRQASTSRRGP